MLSSNDIASMFAAQQSQFAAQGAFAQQITANAGIATPPNNSLASWGSAPPPPRQPSPFPNVNPMPPAFSYDPMRGMQMGQGYGGGNRFASAAMSATSGLGTIGGMALGFSRFAPLVDPLAGAMGGFAAGGVGGAMAGAALPLALGYGASKVAGSFIEGGQQRMQMNQTLGQNFSFVNPASRTGQGFTRHDATAISGVVKSLAETPELLTSFQELNSLIPKLKAAGTFSGVKDAHEFNTRFKESVRTLKDMSKILGTTMSEAAEFFQHSAQVGYSSPMGQRANAINLKYTSAITGMSGQQVMDMQSGGANMARGMGIRRGIGAQAVMRNAQQLQAGLDSGGLSQGLLEDLSGGATGDEAMAGAAQNITGALAGLYKDTSFGKQSLLAATKFDKSGKAIGIDAERARRIQEGSLGWAEQKKIISGFSSEQKASAMGHIDSLSMEMAGMGGASGFASQVAGMRDRGYSDEKIRYQLKKLTGSENMADALMQMEGQQVDPGEMKAMQGKMSRDAARKERRDPKAILDKIKTTLHRETLGKVEEVGGKFFDKLSDAYDSFWDDVFQDYSVTLSKEGGEKIKNAFNATGESDMKAMFKDAQGAGMGGGKVSRGMSGGDFLQNMAGMGVFGASGMAMAGKGPLDSMAAMGRGLRDSEFAAALTGERTEGAQYRMQLGRFGGDVEGLTDEARDRVARQNMLGAQKFGAGLETLDQSNIRGAVLSRLAGQGVDVEGLSAGKRYEKERDTVAEALGRSMNESRGFLGSLKSGVNAGDLMKSGASYADVETAAGGRKNVVSSVAKNMAVSEEDAEKMVAKAQEMGGSFADSIAAQVGFGKDALGAQGGLASEMYNGSAELRAKKTKEAEQFALDKLGAGGAAMLKSRPKLAKLLLDPELRGKLQRVAGIDDPDEKKKALELLAGVPVTHDEMVTLMGINASAQTADGKRDVTKAIRDMTTVMAVNDLAIHRKKTEDLANSITGTDDNSKALKASLQKFAEAKNYEEYTSGRADVGSASAKMIESLEKMSEPERAKAMEGLGSDVRSAVGSAMGVGAGLRKQGVMSKEKLTDYLKKRGLSEDEASRFGNRYGDKKLTDTAISNIEKSVAGQSFGKSGSKDIQTGDKDTEMLNTMKAVQKSIDMNTSVLLVANKGISNEDIRKQRARLQDNLLETTNSKEPATK